MIDRSHALSPTGQVQQLGISCGSIYYLPHPVSDAELTIMRRIDELRSFEYDFHYAIPEL